MMTPQTKRTLFMITLITSSQCSRLLIKTRDNKTNANRSFLIRTRDNKTNADRSFLIRTSDNKTNANRSFLKRTSENKTNAKKGHGEGGADYYDSSDYDYYHAANQGLLIFIIT